ncbi:aminoacyltransferase [Streptococcus suis]|uniref:aminoacyltransferase n=1 Tax=Streptococcus suis TaxID=1307 RepID=UPI00211975CF|nr:aminoacyltransferase [Streptococcus suis]
MTLTIISAESFQKHIDQAEFQFFEQSPQMALLLEKRGYDVKIVGYEVAGDIKVSGILFSTPIAGGLHMELHNGPIFTDRTYLKDFYQALQIFARQNNAIELKVKPYLTYQQFDTDGSPIAEPDSTVITDLTSIGYEHHGLQTGYKSGDWYYIKDLTGLTQDTLFKSFSKKGKPLVKKAKTFGMKIKKLERNQLSLFKEITSATSNRREFDDKPLEYYEYLYDSFGEKAEFLVVTLNFQDYWQNLSRDQEKLKEKIDRLASDLEHNPNSEKKQNQHRELSSQYDTFEVRKQEAQEFINRYGQKDVHLCASLFVYLDKEAYYLHSGSYPEFNKFYAPAILQEHVMLEAIKRGITSYNFLGIMGIFDGSDGVLRFKQNFNGYIEHKPGIFMYYPKPIKFKFYRFIKKLLGRI